MNAYTAGGNLFSLTLEQERIAYSPADFPQVVFAPPGTGKTHTVIARIHHLVERVGLLPQELIVLCFTRAAVTVVTKRLKGLILESKVHDDLRFVSIRTFDSFATQLLLAADPSKELNRMGFDQRIQLAVEALNDPESSESILVAQFRHIIVDEIQDLVGVRARLVKALLLRIDGGFTLLGDPAQAIYGFSDKGKDRMSPQELLTWVSLQEWPEKIIQGELSTNFRSTGHIDEIATEARAIVMEQQKDGAIAESGLQQLISHLPEARLSRINQELRTNHIDESVCILCRTHGELLQIGTMLAAQNIEFYIRPKSDEMTLPGWLARTLCSCTDSRISVTEFENLWNDKVGCEIEPGAEQAYRWLKYVEKESNSDLNIQVLRTNLLKGARLPDDADGPLARDGRRMSLSTIHAAKGREFDHVVVLQPVAKDRNRTDDEYLEEARVLYVAATRARDELSKLSRDGLPTKMRRITTPSRRMRWMTLSEDGRTAYLELGLPGDMVPDFFVGNRVFPELRGVKEAQNAIWKLLHPGAPLEIQFTRDPERAYQVMIKQVNGTLIKLTSLSGSFWNDFFYILKMLNGGKRFRYPAVWRNVRATAMTSEVLPFYPENVYEPFATSGFCLGLKLRGLIEINLES